MGADLREGLAALSAHGSEYAIEAGLLGVFMLVACAGSAMVNHPGSPVARRLVGPLRRRAVMGVLMGLTAVALIYSPAGARSGAHMNPATTLTYWLLGKVGGWDAAFYVLFQFIGGLAGVGLARVALGRVVAHPSVNFVATVPGRRGVGAAWAGEFVIGLVLMSVVLATSNHPATAAYTGVVVGVLVAVFIVVEAPLSGMSLNPARTLGSAVAARSSRGLWVYFTAPPVGMVCAALVYTGVTGHGCVHCAKLNHPDGGACHFRCEIGGMRGAWSERVNPSAPDGIEGEGGR
ncbi:MAG: MIP/aquaporin family protein [Phycisphaerales bacterium]